jgi:hypothetical protein
MAAYEETMASAAASLAESAALAAEIAARQEKLRASLIELEPGSWDIWWRHTISSPDEFGYYDFIIRHHLFPIAKNYGFNRPTKLAGFMMHAGAFPDWFKITVFNHIKGVLAMRRMYTLDQMMRLIEGMYGLPRGVIQRL